MNTLLITVDSLRKDHFKYMSATNDYLDETHERAFATSTATIGSFPAIVGGEYADGTGLYDGTSVANHFDGYAVGITTNHLLSQEYGYQEGFDLFKSPRGGGNTLKEKGAIILTQGSLFYRIASWGWSKYQWVSSLFGEVSKSFRSASAVIDQFGSEIAQVDDEWFGWLHFMEPHHPYDPDGTGIERVEAQRLTRRVLSGNGSDEDEERVRRLYRREIEELDSQLERLWETVPEDTRVVFCADHGELLGENGVWGHPGEMRPELLNVPFGTRNAPELGDVISLIDVPTILRGEQHGQGTLDRDIAFSTYGEKKAAATATNFINEHGIFDIETWETTSDPRLERAYNRFDSRHVINEDALMEDLEELGYA